MFVEYIMSKEFANNLLKERKGEDRKKHPQQYLCEYVNSQYNLLYPCTRVTYA